ncbi:3'(2'),5'-bisphosphate nucleotidase CysQ [Sphingomonas cannabina]|uniref:inositol monophosphatase family protein n=1 Tax=Sphingomonas cannabina TaxID=2899123 RepID=UPI001F44E09F|nr:inositol monophosphatase family protein [Sphingomonas cannabina]UIJ46984.1 3'(2'),5'-bisphosphate nucleotidase CysQ [Sphingomonas cannabina]
MTDAELAHAIAGEAGTLLLELRRGRAPGRALGDAGDREAQALIAARLAAARPDDFVLSEEAADDPARCAASRLWVVDPLDGTAEYAEGRDDWAVHIGLSIDGAPAAGAVALPARGLVIATDAPPPPAPLHQPPRMVVSRSRAPHECPGIAAAIGAELVPMGSAGAKAMAVVLGEADIYLHSGGQYVWDNCAPAAVALAAGLHVSRLDGSPLVYNCVDTYLPDLLICRPELAEPVLRLVRG